MLVYVSLRVKRVLAMIVMAINVIININPLWCSGQRTGVRHRR